MKSTIVFTKNNNNTYQRVEANGNQRTPLPPISLYTKNDQLNLNKYNCIRVKLRTVPTDDESTLYDKYIPYLTPSTATPEVYCNFCKDLKIMFHGTNVQNGPMRYALIRDLGLLKGHFRRDFDSFASEYGAETVAV